jgi:hypothetical protein
MKLLQIADESWTLGRPLDLPLKEGRFERVALSQHLPKLLRWIPFSVDIYGLKLTVLRRCRKCHTGRQKAHLCTATVDTFFKGRTPKVCRLRPWAHVTKAKGMLSWPKGYGKKCRPLLISGNLILASFGRFDQLWSQGKLVLLRNFFYNFMAFHDPCGGIWMLPFIHVTCRSNPIYRCIPRISLNSFNPVPQRCWVRCSGGSSVIGVIDS